MYTLKLTGAIQGKRITPAKGKRCQQLLQKGNGEHVIKNLWVLCKWVDFFITATIKGGSFAYYKTANFLAVLCLRAYTFFCFQAFSCVCYRQIDSLQRHASARSLSFSTFLPRKIDFINSIRRAEVIHIPNRLSTSGLIAATNSHLTPTKNR